MRSFLLRKSRRGIKTVIRKDVIKKAMQKQVKTGQENTKKDIQAKHTIMEYDNEIKYCKSVLKSGTTKENKDDAKKRLERAEKCKKKLEKDK